MIRELTAEEPLVDLAVFADRNFTLGSVVMALAGFGFYASMLLLALYTQKLMSYDAWTSGLVLAPSGIGQAVMLDPRGPARHRARTSAGSCASACS